MFKDQINVYCWVFTDAGCDNSRACQSFIADALVGMRVVLSALFVQGLNREHTKYSLTTETSCFCSVAGMATICLAASSVCAYLRSGILNKKTND
jgi:hypothetical protein